MSSKALAKSMMLLNELQEQLKQQAKGIVPSPVNSTILQDTQGLNKPMTPHLGSRITELSRRSPSQDFKKNYSILEVSKSPEDEASVIDSVMKETQERYAELKRKLQFDTDHFSKDCENIQDKIKDILRDMKTVMFEEPTMGPNALTSGRIQMSSNKKDTPMVRSAVLNSGSGKKSKRSLDTDEF